MPAWEPGAVTAIFGKLEAEAVGRGRLALGPLAAAVEKQARINLSGFPHAYGTRTPSPGDPVGPGLISGALRKSITHSRIERTAEGWETRVGTAGGVLPPKPPYPPSARTPTSRYGLFLETGASRGGKFPFLKPAFDMAVRFAAPAIYTEMYGSNWRRID